MRIGIDIDGVIADFAGAFHKRLEDRVGYKISSSLKADWSDVVSQEIFQATFDELDNSFWESLPLLPHTTLLPELMLEHDCRFYTTRHFMSAGAVTKKWLRQHFPVRDFSARIYASENKVALMEDVEAYIDDDPVILNQVREKFPAAQLFIKTSVYNYPRLASLNFRAVANFDIFAAKFLVPSPAAGIRHFDTGATRDTDLGKPRYASLLSPLVIRRFGEYMTAHRRQSGETLRDFDNWKKGIPKREYLESAFRHLLDVWLLEDGFQGRGSEEEALCAILFNAQGLLHELLKERGYARSNP